MTSKELVIKKSFIRELTSMLKLCNNKHSRKDKKAVNTI